MKASRSQARSLTPASRSYHQTETSHLPIHDRQRNPILYSIEPYLPLGLYFHAFSLICNEFISSQVTATPWQSGDSEEPEARAKSEGSSPGQWGQTRRGQTPLPDCPGLSQCGPCLWPCHHP